MTKRTSPEKLWNEIEKSGGINAYIEKQLEKRGYLVQRQETMGMSKRELKNYKQSLKDEAAERKKLRKESWQAYKSNHIVHLGEGIYWNDGDDFDKWDIENPEKRIAENELPVIDSPEQLAKVLDLTIGKLRWLSYHRDAATSLHYYRFTIPKKRGGDRDIWAPMPLLKKTQRWILENIAEKLLVHGAAHGFLPSRSIYTNAITHRNPFYLIKMDIKDFFPSVSYARVKGIFRKAGYREQVATLLALICTEAPRKIVEFEGKKHFVSLGQRCLPQGAPTSPALTNTLCMKMDSRLYGLAKKFGCRYSRYADDITFSIPREKLKGFNPGAVIEFTKRIVKDEGFVIHPDKTKVIRPNVCQRVTGLVVNDDQKPRVSRDIKRKLRAAIHNLKNGKPMQEGDSLERLKGIAAYINMSEPKLGEKYLNELKTFNDM
ncbi:MAG: RNA-directed DNA polymerase [Desulfobacterales bacterium]|nr:RNA-directed DNA polymerase [Desulfobacterales bacterium]MCP4159149.1 RNA-directed DNA polymerase [Deltaproteobacteria bacterium]